MRLEFGDTLIYAEAEVVEWISYEPSAYHWDSGWSVSAHEIEFFVSDSDGTVYAEEPDGSTSQPVGIAPQIVELRRLIDKGEDNWSAWSEGVIKHDQYKYNSSYINRRMDELNAEIFDT